MLGLYIAIGIFVVGFVIMAGSLGLFRRLMRTADEDVNNRFPLSNWVLKDPCNYFGLKSKGAGQVRGNGVLVLTEKELACRQLVPANWIEIYLERITSIEHPRSFMGKSKGSELLVVHFTNMEGEDDAAGFLVQNPHRWAEEIERLLGSG